ncbi:transposase family protein [Streptomyces sp. NBC_01007]|nr:transposase family protein [Streptomyces sp. NBC_01007]
MPTSSPIPPALDRLCDRPRLAPAEVPGRLERPTEVPDPRDPRGVRHTLAVVLALTACAVPTGARSLPTAGGRRPAPTHTPGTRQPIRHHALHARRPTAPGRCKTWPAGTVDRLCPGRDIAHVPHGQVSRARWVSAVRPRTP